MYWICISFVILGVIGWGSVEHSMVIFGAYFAWAFVLIFSVLFAKVFHSKIVLGKVLLSFIVVVIGLFNIIKITDYVIHVGTFR
ncbi:hypothetical protein D3C84_1092430 [compost metagenome]